MNYSGVWEDTMVVGDVRLIPVSLTKDKLKSIT